MKKKYISPATSTIRVETHQMIAGTNLNDNPQSITPTEEEYNEEFSSRIFDIWDENAE